jgi:hypothetical protein
MSYVYLLDLYQIINMRIEAANQLKNKITTDPGMKNFQEGRIETLSDINEFLIKNLNPKLPHALRKAADYNLEC